MTYYHAPPLEYKTLKDLEEEKIIDLGGLRFKKANGKIEPGDFYIAERNTGPHFLECAYIKDNCVYPTNSAYPYSTWECVKVEEV